MREVRPCSALLTTSCQTKPAALAYFFGIAKLLPCYNLWLSLLHWIYSDISSFILDDHIWGWSSSDRNCPA